jgi:hypothetical protein
MRCRGKSHGTHPNDSADNSFKDIGDRRDDRVEAVANGGNNGTLRYGKLNQNIAPARVDHPPLRMLEVVGSS